LLEVSSATRHGVSMHTLYQVDAFTDHVFGGNPAAVMPLEAWLADGLMQQIAEENNLSETAFFVPATDGAHDYRLRWFTPVDEVDLCGHATLAAAFIIFTKLGFSGDVLRFASRSGTLTVAREGDLFTLDFPAWSYEKLPQHTGLTRALGVVSREIYQSQDWLVVLESRAQLEALAPDFGELGILEGRGILVTAPGDAGSGVDFVSRAFFPKLGIDEDPVTGSAHCVLTPYWSRRLSKSRLTAEQLSKRRGKLICELHGERVKISGSARLFMEGVCSI
jgi:PhzF family phenazine biosynthesis protein